VEIGRPPGRHFDGDRPGGIDEIVDVDPVGPAPPLRGLAQHGLHGFRRAGAGRPDHEQIESRLFNLCAESQCLCGARLPHEAVERKQVRGRSELQGRQIGAAVKAVGWEWCAAQTFVLLLVSDVALVIGRLLRFALQWALSQCFLDRPRRQYDIRQSHAGRSAV
jgi:hypothetical protein